MAFRDEKSGKGNSKGRNNTDNSQARMHGKESASASLYHRTAALV